MVFKGGGGAGEVFKGGVQGMNSQFPTDDQRDNIFHLARRELTKGAKKDRD